METIIALLSEKNTYLEKFHYLNEQELINFGIGDFDAVESFYHARDKILDLVGCLDGLVDEENKRLTGEITQAQRTEVGDLLRSKDELVKSILAQDLQLLSYIEKEKSNIIRELKTTGAARRAVGAYGHTERMKELDEKI